MSLSDYTDNELRNLKPGNYTEREIREELLRRTGAKMTPTGWKMEGKTLCVHGIQSNEQCNCGAPLYPCPKCNNCWCM